MLKVTVMTLLPLFSSVPCLKYVYSEFAIAVAFISCG